VLAEVVNFPYSGELRRFVVVLAQKSHGGASAGRE
jgi:hypothetical protein